MIRFHALGQAIIVLVLVSCGSGEVHLPNSAGGQGEVLVVMAKGHWEGEPGAAVRSILEQPVPGLPQREGRFSLAQTTPENFGSLLSVHHCVLVAIIDASADTVAVRSSRDRYARGQTIVQISAHDPVTWIRMMQRNGLDITDILEGHQRDRVAKRLAKERDASLASSLKAQHHLSIDIPGGFHVMEQDDHFTWLQRDRVVTSSGLDHNVIEGVLVYSYPYESDSTFTVPFLTDVRDVMTKRYVEGPNAGSYMIVQRSFETMDLLPSGRITSLDGRFAYVMNGLFGMHGAKMGGPFVSITTLDENSESVLTVEGFVYAPQFDKREYLRELEALIFSVRLDPAASP